MDALVSILPFVLVIGVFWFLLIRPQQRRMREANAMQQALQPGDEVMLTSGVFATVAAIADDRVHVTISDGVTIQVARGAIGQILVEPEASHASADDTTGLEEND